MRKVIVDSNILMLSIKYGVNIKQAIEDALVFRCEICVPKAVIDELEEKARHGKLIERKTAKQALHVVHEYKMRILNDEKLRNIRTTDDIILSLASKEKCVLITNDRELRKKARRLNIPVGFLNIEEKRIIVEYSP